MVLYPRAKYIQWPPGRHGYWPTLSPVSKWFVYFTYIHTCKKNNKYIHTQTHKIFSSIEKIYWTFWYTERKTEKIRTEEKRRAVEGVAVQNTHKHSATKFSVFHYCSVIFFCAYCWQFISIVRAEERIIILLCVFFCQSQRFRQWSTARAQCILRKTNSWWKEC